MAHLEDLAIASLNKEQLEKLKEAERFINIASGAQDIYLLALTKN